jgi:hypothetical protein
MDKITIPSERQIIPDFAEQIKRNKIKIGPKPTNAVIDFRNWKKDGIEKPIELVSLDLLRYRKDNGRIASDVMDYERSHGVLKEDSANAQKIIENFLRFKDREKTDELYRSIQHTGQSEPAIITCDGFLINGNRRRMVLGLLRSKYPNDERFQTMKVVILPGKDDEGGPPTLYDIEKIENRYQLQSDGKAEYYKFDRALSIRRKIDIGMSIKEQLLDDPTYAGRSEKEINDAIKEYEREYLKPLECIDRYLEYLKRDGLYSSISTGIGDPEGRWQAFYDYSKVWEQLKDESKRINLQVSEKEIGKIEDVAFKIIRKRELKELPKVHQIMRNIPKYLKNTDSKKELLKISDVPIDIKREEKYDKDGNEYDEKHLDRLWGEKYETDITRQVKRADQLFRRDKDINAPIAALEEALDKLNNDSLEDLDIGIGLIDTALKLSIQIRNRAQDLEHAFYGIKKNMNSLGKNNSEK